VFLSETPRQTLLSVFVCYLIVVFLSETPRQTSFSVFVCYVIAVFLSETPRQTLLTLNDVCLGVSLRNTAIT
jgi:hypothetical protein